MSLPTDQNSPPGVYKPNCLFIGEPPPSHLQDTIASDVSQCDLLIALGSTLTNFPAVSLIHRLPSTVPQIFIGPTQAGPPNHFDSYLLGDCESICVTLARALNWELDLAHHSSLPVSSLPRSLPNTTVHDNCIWLKGAPCFHSVISLYLPLDEPSAQTFETTLDIPDLLPSD